MVCLLLKISAAIVLQRLVSVSLVMLELIMPNLAVSDAGIVVAASWK